MEVEIKIPTGNENTHPLEQTGKLAISDQNEIETKKGNYLLLNSDEAEAIKYYSGRGNVMVNMLFNTDIDAILPRLQHWARADENIESSLNDDVVNKTINLYSALLKSYDFHNSDADVQEHPTILYRGSTGTHHSDGFKSFTEIQAMAESFGQKVFAVSFPKDIPYLSHKDIYNYAPHTSRREEKEYLFPPFCEIKPFYSKGDLVPRGYMLSKKDFEFSIDNLPSNINENLSIMAKNILRYKKNARTIEDLEGYQNFDSDYDTAMAERIEINETYKKMSKEVLNYIMYQCVKLDNDHENNRK